MERDPDNYLPYDDDTFEKNLGYFDGSDAPNEHLSAKEVLESLPPGSELHLTIDGKRVGSAVILEQDENGDTPASISFDTEMPEPYLTRMAIGDMSIYTNAIPHSSPDGFHIQHAEYLGNDEMSERFGGRVKEILGADTPETRIEDPLTVAKITTVAIDSAVIRAESIGVGKLHFTDHKVEFTLNTGGTIDGKVTCHAKEGAECRIWCEEGCEYADEAHDSHKLVDQGTCGRIPYFEDYVLDCYNGKTVPLRDGYITLEWDGDGYTWSYAEPLNNTTTTEDTK